MARFFIAFCALAAAAAAALLPVSSISGSWAGFTNALPNPRLPHVPMAGNGALGLMLDARNDTHTAAGGGGGGDSTFDLYLNSASFWSCGACANKLTSACCRLVPLGVVSISLAGTFPAPSALAFTAAQRIEDGRIFANFSTPAGGVCALAAFVHPQQRVALATLQWLPGAGDPPALRVAVSVWTPPAGPAPGEPKPYKPAGTLPAPASAGCAPAPCPPAPAPGGGGVAITASRQASAVPNGTAVAHPIWGALAVALGGLPPSVAVALSAAPPAGASAALALPAGLPLLLAVGAAEAAGGGEDPSAAAAALAAAAAAAPAAAAAEADAFWAEFWSRSWVSLPGAPWAEQLWHGAQYALAATSSTDPRVPAPGLFGVWATSDEVGWNGDYSALGGWRAAPRARGAPNTRSPLTL